MIPCYRNPLYLFFFFFSLLVLKTQGQEARESMAFLTLWICSWNSRVSTFMHRTDRIWRKMWVPSCPLCLLPMRQGPQASSGQHGWADRTHKSRPHAKWWEHLISIISPALWYCYRDSHMSPSYNYRTSDPASARLPSKYLKLSPCRPPGTLLQMREKANITIGPQWGFGVHVLVSCSLTYPDLHNNYLLNLRSVGKSKLGKEKKEWKI